MPRKLDKIAAEYDLRRSEGSLSRKKEKSLEAEAEETISVDSKRLVLNANKSVAVELIPSLHALLSNAKVVMDEELRRFARRSQKEGLSNEDQKSYASMVHSLCRLITTEASVTKADTLQTMADEKLEKMAKQALKSLGKDDEDG
jgi:hypothetical protein